MSITYKLKDRHGLPITAKSPNIIEVANDDKVPNLRCPHCLHMGAFSRIGLSILIRHRGPAGPRNDGTQQIGMSLISVRSCPNTKCSGIVLVVTDVHGRDAVCLPNEVLDFDATDIPPAIAASLEEAIKCHSAQCYKAGALMVRRVLEEFCEDRSATGSNLKDRIRALSKTIVVPQALLQAADHLRLLGNDAAHIEAKSYASIGEPELRVAIDLTKELLKSAYQYSGLVGRLTALQKPTP